jgi:hypothetical protein
MEKISTLKAKTHNTRSVYLQYRDRAYKVDAGQQKDMKIKHLDL